MSRTLAALVMTSALFLASNAYSESLEDYAKKCDAATGETVPDFDCDLGTLVPDSGQNAIKYGWGAKCDRPNVLNHECDPGSRFQVLVNTANAVIVAHCRKKNNDAGTPSDDGKYADIAVIQYGKKNGATCFYQAPVDTPARLEHSVKAPSKGQAAYTWFSPDRTAAIHCGECHDSGPFIRTPYLEQLNVSGATNVVPDFNDDPNKYSFVGDDFKGWKTYSISIPNNTCLGCHRMAVSNMAFIGGPTYGGGGTGRMFGIIATDAAQAAKNPHSASSPIWMTPSDVTYSAGNAQAAKQISECALQFVKNKFNSTKPLPYSCSVSKLAGAFHP